RQRLHTRTCKERTTLVDWVCRFAVHDGAFRRVWIDEYLGEGEDRLLGPVGGDELGVGVEADPEAARAPARRRLAKLRQPGREGILRSLGQRFDECLPDHRIGRLVGIALAEVD